MYLIDSSLWIEYLRPHGSKKVKDRLKEILRREEGCCCGVIAVEVLRGAKTEKDWNMLWEALSSLPQLPLDDDVVERASKWGFMLDRKGKTASTTDLLIASAAHKKAKLIHLDSDFAMIAAVTGLDEERL
ncbi:MAG: PIN domain-containing protein [Acidobacteria bacterium]|nr:PIN domain-containing protein [Acidobacteriota bacterium]